MNKNTFFFFSVLLLGLSNTTNAQSLWSISGGSSIGGTIVQNSQTYNSGFSPDFTVSGAYLLGEGGPAIGLAFEWNPRLINVKEINFFSKNYKFISDFYVGPAVFLGGIDDYALGIMISGQIGFSVNADSWDYSFKVAADILLGAVSIGVFYRPETQLIKEKSWDLKYGEYGLTEEFVLQPAWGVRLGFVIPIWE